MKEIVGIQFKNASRVYYFSPLDYKFKVLEEYYLSLETFIGEKSLKFGTDNIKDSVLIYCKH